MKPLWRLLKRAEIEGRADDKCESIDALKFGLSTLPALESTIELERDLHLKNYQITDKDVNWAILIHYINETDVHIKNYEISSINFAKGETSDTTFETIEFKNFNANIDDLVKLLRVEIANRASCCNSKTYETMKLAASIPIGPHFEEIYIIEGKYIFLVNPQKNVMTLISKGKSDNSLQATMFTSKVDNYFGYLLEKINNFKH